MLKLIDIKKEYPSGDTTVFALKGINLEFRQNEFVSILGQSGGGKTTLLNIIGGLDKYTSGDLLIENVSTKNFKDADWDSYRNYKIGFVFQSYNLISHLNILNNVELALTLGGVSSKERKQRAIDALTEVGLKDHIYKMPNQLSGGQMQRVAIARAIVNNPEILLADEPTGALDTATSIQIMDLIKKISEKRLVIMVTHNPELAKKYSTRIVRLKDGQIIEDTNPYTSEKENNAFALQENSQNQDDIHTDTNIIDDTNPQNQNFEKKKKKKRKNTKNSPFSKTSMSLWTALTLSFKNLFSKKGRTILVSIASSIGIIGVTLVLALSNGFNLYIQKLQSDMLSTYPLIVNGKSVDFNALSQMYQDDNLDKFPDIQNIVIEKLIDKIKNTSSGSDITQDFIDKAIKTLDPKLYYDVLEKTGQYLNIYTLNENNNMYKYVDVNVPNAANTDMVNQIISAFGGDPTWQTLINNQDFILSQYDLINGNYPQNANEVVLFVDKFNQVQDTKLMNIGYKMGDENKLDFNKIVGKTFFALPNNDFYKKETTTSKTYFSSLKREIAQSDFDKSNAVEIKISGILRPKENTQNMIYGTGIACTSQLYQTMLAKNLNSEIVNFAKSNPTIDPFTGNIYSQNDDDFDKRIRQLGGESLPNNIFIYPVNFEAKNLIKDHIDAYNANLPNDKQVHYQDIMELFMSALTTLVDIISYVLIAFSSIALIVSSIMIAVITYVSVIERTKEIGILRSIGARKKDISRVFNAETFIIGLLSGILSIVISLLLTIPINLIINSLADGIGNLAVISPITALVMILISVVLTMLSGFIPSKMAAKKDPIQCLRNE